MDKHVDRQAAQLRGTFFSEDGHLMRRKKECELYVRVAVGKIMGGDSVPLHSAIVLYEVAVALNEMRRIKAETKGLGFLGYTTANRPWVAILKGYVRTSQLIG